MSCCHLCVGRGVQFSLLTYGCRPDKERENAAALEVLPDLLRELDACEPRQRFLSLSEGALAANIFDWGAKACVDLYHNGTILDIYRCGAPFNCELRVLYCIENVRWYSLQLR